MSGSLARDSFWKKPLPKRLSELTLPSSPFGRALRNVGWMLTGKGVGAALSLAYLALAARSLSRLEFGQFMLIFSTAQAIAALVGFQTWQIVIRFGVRHDRIERPPVLEAGGPLGRLIRYCLAMDAVAAVVGSMVAFGVMLAMQARLGWSNAMTGQALAFCIVLLLSIRSTAVGILRLHDRFAVGAIADSITPMARMIGAAVAVLAGASVTGFLIAWAAAEVATAAAYWIGVRREAPGLIGKWEGADSAPAEHPGFWKFAAATNVNSTLNAASRQFIVVLVGFAVGPVAAGSYRLAWQLSQSLVRLSDMFARGVFPELARADHALTRADLHKLYAQSTRLALWAGLAICVLAPLLGQPILLLVGGKTYLSAYPLLVMLSIAAGLEVMAVGYEPLLVATGRAGWALRIRIAGVALMAGILMIWLPSQGIVVAGAASLVAGAVSLILFWRAARTAMRG